MSELRTSKQCTCVNQDPDVTILRVATVEPNRQLIAKREAWPPLPRPLGRPQFQSRAVGKSATLGGSTLIDRVEWTDERGGRPIAMASDLG